MINRPFLAFLAIVLGTTFMSADRARAEESESAKLHAIFAAEWERSMKDHPTWASSLGDLRYNDRWPDVGLQAFKDRHRHRQKVLEALAEIDTAKLSPADRLNYAMFRREYQVRIESHQYRWYLVPLTARDGIQDAGSLSDALSFQTEKDYTDWLARLRSFPRYMEQTIALMREGIAQRRLQPKVVMKRVPTQLRKQIVDDPTRSLFFKPFREFPEELEPEVRERLTDEATQAIAEHVVPAYRDLLTFFESEYLPACFDKVGVWQIPDGKEFYAFRARKYTTTALTPKEIHDIGLREVARIRAEMEKVIAQTDFEGTFAEFLQHLRTDPQFYFEDANELLAAYRAVSKQIDPKLPELFGRLPRIPYGVEAIPMHIAPDTTTAYYRPPSADGRRAGTYFVNLYRPEVRPKYEMEALSLHEAVPGHHLQIALAMELDDLPNFRRFNDATYTAYVEGWALYGESLGEELGLYRDPYAKFGQLTYEMWRAVRLVVDTGMHYFGWSRQEAIDFFAANTAKTLHDIENEIDRYIAWPGQALAYKIGELKIKELRERAERKLGDEFDLRAFHDRVLANGAVPLDVLEADVDAWIKEHSDR